ncbi:hypothetical protein [Glaciimonas sp. PCH181]|uniref:hypothetical protein n=1 Tax=Glaciimonas sp. PCH181 TaxID=2133943 RepID=UPI000D332735|nr:hypothetical protein [Glaciimonas sp. PCH181]PUA19158.1 hypothetical protein C7W93_04490 [Glaciimonas sp. PCH181]
MAGACYRGVGINCALVSHVPPGVDLFLWLTLIKLAHRVGIAKRLPTLAFNVEPALVSVSLARCSTGPSAPDLILLARRSSQVMQAFYIMTGRTELADSAQFELREMLTRAIEELDTKPY